MGSKILCRDQALALKLMVNSDLSIVSKGKRSLMAKLIGIARRCVLAALLCLAPLVLAQNPTGVLRGIVLDSSGARISAAKIEIHLPGAAIARTILCDARRWTDTIHLPIRLRSLRQPLVADRRHADIHGHI